MSSNFPNNPSDSNLPGSMMADYNNTAQEPLPVPGESPMVGPGGKTKISASADAPHAGEQVGYGYMSPDLKNVGTPPTGTTLPIAQPIPIMTFGDPADTSIDAKDAYSPTGSDISRYGFDKPNN